MFASQPGVSGGVVSSISKDSPRIQLAKKDRRAAKRYALELPFTYRLFGRGQLVQEGIGRTLNMSSNGLLIQAGARLTKGQPIELSVQLPPGGEGSAVTQLVILGHVVRSDISETSVRIVRHGFMHIQPPSHGLVTTPE